MVAKISYGKNLFGVLEYNLEKVKANKGTVLCVNNVLYSNEQPMHSLLKSFETYLVNNRKTEKPILHVSLNPHPKDKLSDNQLKEIAAKYLRDLGYGDQPYVVFKHSDLEREHIHIVTLRVDQEGKKIKDQFEHIRSKEITNKLEIEYKLHKADEQKLKADEPLKIVDYKKGDLKKQIRNIVHTISTYKFQSIKEYKTALGIFGVTFEEVTGIDRNGLPFHGIVYYAIDKNGNKKSNPIKASRLSVGDFKALSKQMERTKKDFKNFDRTRLILIIRNAMQKTNKLEKFKKLLAKQGISAIFRINESGRIYGVTFVDHKEKIIVNGSRLGKEFSANIFETYFHGFHTSALREEKSNTNSRLSMPTIPTFNSTVSGNDVEENELTRRKRRRKRKKGIGF